MRFNTKLSALIALTLVSAAAPSAHAISVGFQAGMSMPSPSASYGGSKLLLGGEIGSKFGPLTIGAFYDHTAFTLASGAAIPNTFYGGFARLGFAPALPLFVDAKAGPTYCSDSDSQIGYGVGLGWDFAPIPGVTIAPKVSYRSLPRVVNTVTSTLTSIDFTLLLGLGF